MKSICTALFLFISAAVLPQNTGKIAALQQELADKNLSDTSMAGRSGADGRCEFTGNPDVKIHPEVYLF